MSHRTRTNTNPNDTEANAACRSGNARALRKQSKCGMNHEGMGHRGFHGEILFVNGFLERRRLEIRALSAGLRESSKQARMSLNSLASASGRVPPTPKIFAESSSASDY